jgi:hypothetical protein
MLISLGFSCQTRFMIDALSPGGRRNPFDFNITGRAALVAALASDGASLRHGAEDAAPYRMPVEGREGIFVRGMYFWHDYPLAGDGLTLHPDWRAEIVRVNEKYAALWGRFAARLRDGGEKVLVLSNAQKNLGEFAADAADFSRRFGLGRQAFAEIAAALDAFGAKNYRLVFLSRTAAEVEETAGLRDGRLDHRFAGPLRLRPDAATAARLLSWPRD